MIDTLKLIQFDLQPKYLITVTDSTGGAVDITGATIRCSMSLERSTTLTINRSTAGVTITGATSGQFEYQWQSGETDTVGAYDIEFEITPSAGGKFTMPNPIDGVAHVQIFTGLDST